MKRAAARGGRQGTRKTPVLRGAPAYHHGDLRKALLAATENLLDEAGLEDFTLREVARRAGVSHGAPAHHFGDVTGLLSAFTAESFAQLADSMAARRADAGPDPFEQLVATGIGYVDYALSHRARFQLMFRSDRLDSEHAALATSGGRAYGELTACIAALPTRRRSPARDAERTALAWSIVHGFATLMIDNRGFATQAGGDRRDALNLVEALLRRSRPAFTEQ
jgi:AcrR family transcriptional regulator